MQLLFRNIKQHRRVVVIVFFLCYELSLENACEQKQKIIKFSRIEEYKIARLIKKFNIKFSEISTLKKGEKEKKKEKSLYSFRVYAMFLSFMFAQSRRN